MTRAPRCISIAMLALGCGGPSADDTAVVDVAPTLTLRWVAGHGDDTWERSRAGLWWSLSALGALPRSQDPGLALITDDTDQVVFALDLAQVGLSERAQEALLPAVEPIGSSDEGTQWGAVDLGRFLMLTLYEPWRYYAVTEACPTVDGWAAAQLAADTQVFPITSSMLVEGHRLLEFNANPDDIGGIAWLAAEGEGSIPDGTFVPHENESVDVMANGRQRYAVYDHDGLLAPAASPALSPAGQPGRCMWCHENHLMDAIAQPDVDGYASDALFDDQIAGQQGLIEQARDGLDTSIDFDTHDVHAWAEQIVESFLSPPVARLALEWGVSPEDVQALVLEHGGSWSDNDEYPD